MNLNWKRLAKIFNFKLENLVLRNKYKIFLGDKIGKADLSMFSEIWYENFYNPRGFEINENDIVFDIGANNGFFSIYAASKALRGKVYAFEPVPSLAKKIKMSSDLNNFDNIIIEKLAIGNNNSECLFYVSKDHNGCHSLYKRNLSDNKIIVNVISLKSYCESHNISKIDFMKLDCEGAEYEIINEKSIEFIKKTVGTISMEYHDNINMHSHEEILKTLGEAGFSTESINGYIYAKNGNR